MEPKAENKDQSADEYRDLKFVKGRFSNPHAHVCEGHCHCLVEE